MKLIYDTIYEGGDGHETDTSIKLFGHQLRAPIMCAWSSQGIEGKGRAEGESCRVKAWARSPLPCTARFIGWPLSPSSLCPVRHPFTRARHHVPQSTPGKGAGVSKGLGVEGPFSHTACISCLHKASSKKIGLNNSDEAKKLLVVETDRYQRVAWPHPLRPFSGPSIDSAVGHRVNAQARRGHSRRFTIKERRF